MNRLSVVACFLVVSLIANESFGQLFRQRFQSQTPVVGCQVCAGPSCAEQPVLAKASDISTVASVVATTPHVRCVFNGSCGSGTICGADANGAYVLTNAHVVGTQVGRVATIDCVTNAGASRVSGRIVMAGYSDRTMVDFAILHCEGLTSKRYMPLLKTEPSDAPYATTGSPRCVWPQVTKQFNDPRNYGQGLITGSPDAIGGQSGSAIYNSKGQQIALLTWSISGRCAGQKTSKLWLVASQRNVELADPRIPGMVEVGDRPETANGVFGELPTAHSVATNEGPLLANNQAASSIAKIGRLEVGIQNIVGSEMANLPIWFEPPTEPDDGDCIKLTEKERELIEFLRKQAEERGLRDKLKERDWLSLLMKLMPIILEFIKTIQENQQ